MAKRLLTLLILFFVLLGIVYIYPRKDHVIEKKFEKEAPSTTSLKNTPPPSVAKPRRILGVKPDDVQKLAPEDFETDNLPGEEWEDILTQNLEAQGGDSLQEIDIKKTESLILRRDNRKLAVESVVITLTRKDGVQSSFRALVDSETGKVLETWDRPVFDPVHPNENFKVKLNPIYHGN